MMTNECDDMLNLGWRQYESVLVLVNVYLLNGSVRKIIIKMSECKTRELNFIIQKRMVNRINKLKLKEEKAD
jgi:hypothetical protein